MIMDDDFTGVKNGTVYSNEKPVAEISSKLTIDFSKGANEGNAPDPELIMLKIKQQQEKNKKE